MGVSSCGGEIRSVPKEERGGGGGGGDDGDMVGVNAVVVGGNPADVDVMSGTVVGEGGGREGGVEGADGGVYCAFSKRAEGREEEEERREKEGGGEERGGGRRMEEGGGASSKM